MENKKLTLFDLVKHLNEESVDRWHEFEHLYSPFIVNRFLSMHNDIIGFVKEMNGSRMPKQDQYHFYLYGIPNKRRYSKYVKGNKDQTLLLLMEHYKVSRSVAKSYLKLISDKDLEKIEQSNDIGGLLK